MISHVCRGRRKTLSLLILEKLEIAADLIGYYVSSDTDYLEEINFLYINFFKVNGIPS